MSKSKLKTSAARDRIIETAERLFYDEGIRAVGIDRIVDEANVAKMTLYNHFKSKDDLVLAVLEYREEQVTEMFEKRLGKKIGKGCDPLEAFFEVLKEWFENPGFRGCSFINASVELADPTHQASQFAAAHKQRFQKMIAQVLKQGGYAKATSLAPVISMLVEGAIVTAVMQQSSKSASVARRAALSLANQT